MWLQLQTLDSVAVLNDLSLVRYIASATGPTGPTPVQQNFFCVVLHELQHTFVRCFVYAFFDFPVDS